MSGTMSLTIILITLVYPLVTGLGVEVEDVTGRQLEAALQTEDVLAVMFCKSLLLTVVTPRVLLPVCYSPCVTPRVFPGHLINSHRRPVFSFQCYLVVSVVLQTVYSLLPGLLFTSHLLVDNQNLVGR